MDRTIVLQLIKEVLDIKSTIRDGYITAIIEGVIKELEDEKGLILDGINPFSSSFCCGLCPMVLSK